MAIIGFLNTNLTLEGEGVLNFTVGVLQGDLDTSVTVLFTTEDTSAKGSKLINYSHCANNNKHVYIHFVSTFSWYRLYQNLKISYLHWRILCAVCIHPNR